MNQFSILDYLKSGTVVSAKSLGNHFKIRTHEAKLSLNKLMSIEGMCCRQKKVEKDPITNRNPEGKSFFTIYWYQKRNNI